MMINTKIMSKKIILVVVVDIYAMSNWYGGGL